MRAGMSKRSRKNGLRQYNGRSLAMVRSVLALRGRQGVLLRSRAAPQFVCDKERKVQSQFASKPG